MNLSGLISTIAVSTTKETNLIPVDRSEISANAPKNSFEEHLSSSLKDTSKQENVKASSDEIQNKNETISRRENEPRSVDKNINEDKTENKNNIKDEKPADIKTEKKSPLHLTDINAAIVPAHITVKAPDAETSAKKTKDENNHDSKIAPLHNSLTTKSKKSEEQKPLAELHILKNMKSKTVSQNKKAPETKNEKSESETTADPVQLKNTKKDAAFLRKIQDLFGKDPEESAKESKPVKIKEELALAVKNAINQANKKENNHHSAAAAAVTPEKVNTESQTKETAQTSSSSSAFTLSAPLSKESGDNGSSSFMKQFNTPAMDGSNTAKTSHIVQSGVPFADKLDEIISQAKLTVRDAKNAQMSVRLNPDNLGSLNVSLGLENGVLNAKFLVESQEAKETLLSNIHVLKDALSNEGISVGAFQVDVRGEHRPSESDNESAHIAGRKTHEEEKAETEYIARQGLNYNGIINLTA